MLNLYLILAIMVVLALLMLAVPFKLKKKPLFSLEYGLIAITASVFVFTVYYFTGNYTSLGAWLAHDKLHYQLQSQIQALGGIDGIISKIKTRLAANPNDAQGWLILGKLYLSLDNRPGAIEAITKAHQLAPKDEIIARYYKNIANTN